MFWRRLYRITWFGIRYYSLGEHFTQPFYFKITIQLIRSPQRGKRPCPEKLLLFLICRWGIYIYFYILQSNEYFQKLPPKNNYKELLNKVDESAGRVTRYAQFYWSSWKDWTFHFRSQSSSFVAATPSPARVLARPSSRLKRSTPVSACIRANKIHKGNSDQVNHDEILLISVYFTLKLRIRCI